MDTWSVTWTVLPNGLADSGRARLSLVPRLRVHTDTGQLGDSPAFGWPTLVAGLPAVPLEVRAGDRGLPPVMAEVVSAEPSQTLWERLFAVTTPVDVEPPAPETDHFTAAETAVHYGAALDAVRAVYDGVRAASPDGVLPPDHDAWAAVRALAGWSTTRSGLRLAGSDGTDGDGVVPRDGSALPRRVTELLAPTGRTAGRIAEAAEALRAGGLPAAGAALPLALVSQRLRYSGGTSAETRARNAREGSPGSAVTPPKPSHVAAIRSVREADFEQVVGLLGDHPALALVLGLRVDVEIEPFDGDRLLRVRPDGVPPISGPTAVRQPWSAVRCEPARRRFVMRADPAVSPKATEVRSGMLDLSPGPLSKYVLSTTDVYAAAQQLQALSGVVASSDPPLAVALPPQRNAGLVVAQVDRRTGVFQHVLDRAGQLAAAMATRSDDVVLFADDVTSGYRVDVSADGGPFRSLMRRQVAYRVGIATTKAPPDVTTTDEGLVEPITLAEQYDEDEPHLLVGEELFGWDGASLVAPMPGRRVAGEPGRPAVEDDQPALAPGYPLALQVTAEPGTLPRLRFGRSYRVRARTVDPAGNSIAPEVADPALVSGPVRYSRFDPVLAPTVVPRAAFTPGESRDRLVVRSDGEGHPIDGPCERHLLAPKATQRLAETHGEFDAAFGPGATSAERDRQFAIARTESGHLTDPVVRDPDQPTRTVPQPGIAVVVNEGAPTLPTTTLPLPPGAPLPAGEYVVLETDAPHLPWLADPAASGVALLGAPGQAGAVLVPYGSRGRWPDVRPARLVVAAATTTKGATTVSTAGPDRRGVVAGGPPPPPPPTEPTSPPPTRSPRGARTGG